ncbi:MAG: ABC transporter permease [Lactobacillales bacterium]|jgi:D-methionine transport system permease protein|nr:ABC transporter permease [Lactobacillales bacterium]
MNNSLASYFEFQNVNVANLLNALKDTLFMTFVSLFFITILGVLLGLVLFYISRGKTRGARIIYSIVSAASNIFRSIPYIILVILLMGFTKLLVGTTIGSIAAIPSLVVSATPFYARMVEIAFREVDSGILETADSFGANSWQKITKFLIPESLPALVSGLTVTTITLIGFTAMAGAIGGGGLGGLAYQEGFTRGNNAVTLTATVLILVVVFIVQLTGDKIVKKIDKR